MHTNSISEAQAPQKYPYFYSEGNIVPSSFGPRNLSACLLLENPKEGLLSDQIAAKLACKHHLYLQPRRVCVFRTEYFRIDQDCPRKSQERINGQLLQEAEGGKKFSHRLQKTTKPQPNHFKEEV